MKQIIYSERNYHYVIRTQRKRSGPRRVCDHSRARRHCCHRGHALARTQDRQHFQYHQRLPSVTRSGETKKPCRETGLFLLTFPWQ